MLKQSRHGAFSPEVAAMATGVSSASATSDGTGTAEHGLCAHAVHTHPCRLCCSILAMLMAALAQAE
ncbi:hypothetical protein P3W85_44550, partial [Cupriavidus basilensis]